MTNVQIEDDRDDLLGQVMDEFFDAVAAGETPELSDYVRRYPDIADLLKVAIPAMRAAEDTTASADVAIGTTGQPQERQLGDFRLLRQLGRGGMGIVYEAEQISMRRRVALKVLPLAGLVDDLKIRRFQSEVRAVAALDHPNIVSVYSVGEERGVHYFAMQLIRGRNLAQVIESLRKVHAEEGVLNGHSVISQITPLGEPASVDDAVSDTATDVIQEESSYAAEPARLDTVAQADDSTIPHTTRREYFRSVAALGIQAAEALQHAHDLGVVHRDVKPANLLLDKSSRLYVTDFGLARIESEAGVTMTGDLLGTLRYMSPEQALAKRVVMDHRVDIYSLGVTLYELLTLQPAYVGEDRQLLLKQIAFEEPARPRRIDPEIPAELETIVLKAMSKDMDERYSTAHDFGDDLRLFLENRPIKAKPPTIPQIIDKWTRRNPVVTWATIVTLLLVTMAFATSTLLVANQWDEAVRAKQATEEQLLVSTVNRLAAHSLAVQDEKPNESLLLAVTAVDMSQQHQSLAPIAHEALLNATQRLRSGQTLAGHGTKISALKMSSDWLVTMGQGQAHLWDLTSKTPATSSRKLGDDNDVITSLEISENGRWLVTGGSQLRRWDLNARNPDVSPLDIAGSKLTINSISLSHDGRRIAAQSEAGTVTVWDLVDTNRQTSRVISRQTDTTSRFALSPDGRWLATVNSEQRNTTQLWDLHDENASDGPLSLTGHSERIRDLTISADSRWLATASQDQTIRLWDLKAKFPGTSSHVIPTENHDVPAGLLLFSHDARWLFAGSGYTSRILRWDLSAMERPFSKTVLPHNDRVSSMELNRDGRWLVSGSLDGTARFWDLSDGDPSVASMIVPAHDDVDAVSIHPGGRWFATVGNGTARLWDLHGADPTSSPFVLQGRSDDVYSITAISSKGRWIATSVNDNAVQLWDMEAKDPQRFERVLNGPQQTIKSLEISPDDCWLVAGCRDGTAHLWDLTSEDIPSSVKVLGKRGKGMLKGLAVFSPDNHWLAVSNDQQIRLWSLNASDVETPSHVLSGHGSLIESMMISPNSRWLVTGARQRDDPNLRVWDLDSNAPQESSRALNPGDAVYSLTIDRHSRWLATSSRDETVSLWDLGADELATSLRVLPSVGDHWGNGRAPIWRIAISPDAKWLFTSRFDHTAQLWDLSKQVPKPYELRGHNGVQSAAISPNGRWLVAGCRSNAHIWDLKADDPTSAVRVLRGHEQPIWSVRISADSRWLVTDSSDATIRRWCLDTDWLLDHARQAAGRELTKVEREYYGIEAVGLEDPADVRGMALTRE